MSRMHEVIGKSQRRGLALVFATAALSVTATALYASVQTDPLPPAKAAIEDFAASNRAAGQARAVPKPAQDVPVPGATDAPPITGIIQDMDAPISGTDFQPTNAWGGFLNGRFIRVYAGVAPDRPTQGLLFMISAPVDRSGGIVDWDRATQALIATPGAEGPVRIAAAAGSRLRLVSESGGILDFDVLARTFIAP